MMAINCERYTASVREELNTSMEHWWTGENGGTGRKA